MRQPLPVILLGLALASGIFGIVKIAFAFFAWLLQPEDPIFRRHLDTLWDKLHLVSLHDAAIGVLRTIYSRLDGVFSEDRAYTKFVFVCLVINYLCSLLGLGFISANYLFHQGFVRSITELTFGVHFGLLVLALWLALLDAGSLYLTIVFLRRISTRARFSTVLLHIVGELAVLVAVFLIAMAAFHFVLDPGTYGRVRIFPLPITWAVLSKIPELVRDLPSRPPHYFYTIGTLTVFAAFPTLTYCFALLGLVFVWPKWMWRFIRRVIFLITTDKAPVMK